MAGGGGYSLRRRAGRRAGPATPSASRASPAAGRPPLGYDHVVLVVLENHSYAEVVDSSPYLDGLAARVRAGDELPRRRPSEPPELPRAHVGLDERRHERLHELHERVAVDLLAARAATGAPMRSRSRRRGFSAPSAATRKTQSRFLLPVARAGVCTRRAPARPAAGRARGRRTRPLQPGRPEPLPRRARLRRRHG